MVYESSTVSTNNGDGEGGGTEMDVGTDSAAWQQSDVADDAVASGMDVGVDVGVDVAPVLSQAVNSVLPVISTGMDLGEGNSPVLPQFSNVELADVTADLEPAADLDVQMARQTSDESVPVQALSNIVKLNTPPAYASIGSVSVAPPLHTLNVNQRLTLISPAVPVGPTTMPLRCMMWNVANLGGKFGFPRIRSDEIIRAIARIIFHADADFISILEVLDRTGIDHPPRPPFEVRMGGNNDPFVADGRLMDKRLELASSRDWEPAKIRHRILELKLLTSKGLEKLKKRQPRAWLTRHFENEIKKMEEAAEKKKLALVRRFDSAVTSIVWNSFSLDDYQDAPTPECDINFDQTLSDLIAVSSHLRLLPTDDANDVDVKSRLFINAFYK